MKQLIYQRLEIIILPKRNKYKFTLTFLHLDVDVAVVRCGLDIVSALLILAENSDAEVLDEILEILSLHVFPMGVMMAMVMVVTTRVTEDACKQDGITC